MKFSKAKQEQLKKLGARDFAAGKSILAFYRIPGTRHPEWARAAYEIGWRNARDEMRSGNKRCEWTHNDAQCESSAILNSRLCEHHAYQAYVTEAERESQGNAYIYSFEEWRRWLVGIGAAV